jgi:hypothetical protein
MITFRFTPASLTISSIRWISWRDFDDKPCGFLQYRMGCWPAMQINPLLLSIAAPVAAKTARVLVHTAQHLGENFLHTLGSLGEGSPGTQLGAAQLAEAAENSAETADSLNGKLQSLSHRLRDWLAEMGVERPFELKFSVDAAGNEVSNVLGPESERISDLIHEDDGWLQQLAELTRKAQDLYGRSSLAAGRPVELAISADDAWIITSPAASD